MDHSWRILCSNGTSTNDWALPCRQVFRIVSFFWGDPAGYIDRAKAAGAMVIQTVGTPEEAREKRLN